MLRRVLSLASLLAGAPAPLWGQATVETRFPAQAQIVVQRLGAMQVERLREGAEPLLPGDQLLTPDTAFVELRCPPGSGDTYRLIGPFRVLIDVPRRARCHVNLLSGELNILAEQPTEQTVGAITLGSRGTQYVVTARRTADGFTPRVVVFDGDVSVRTGEASIEAGAGSSLTYDAASAGFRTSRVTDQQYRRWSGLYARFDVHEAVERGAAIPEPARDAVQSRLDSLHYQVLTNPEDAERRAALARAQIEYRMIDHARFNLERAGITSDSALRRYRIDPAIIRINR